MKKNNSVVTKLNGYWPFGYIYYIVNYFC